MINPRRVLIVVNLRAGKRIVRGQLSYIIDEFCSAGYIPTVVTTQAAGDAERIVAGKSNDYCLVVCCGGDGTLNETISGMMHAKTRVPIGYIPCGSTNDMANNLGLPRNVIRASKLIIDGVPVEHDIGMFGDRYFTYISSFGAFTRASYATPQKIKNVLGHFAYVLEGAKEIGEIKPYRFRISFDGRTIEDDFIFGSVSNSTSVGGIFSFPKDDVTLNDGMFELLLIRAPKTPMDTTNLIMNMAKKNFHDKNIIFAHTNNVVFEPEKELDWTIDGECSGKVGRVAVDNIPDTIQIIQKKPSILN